ncbi:hypothetical protein SARC_01713 [Sphaeroforma arctica JP610]|uniref:Citrate transporter-like domain-containing protein n=1 Tax=Sphaeroforma arctica JP610 TaxID=667725 RepID=A0A0L0GB72_9EUKA|nr:hypothetical protein SARC_01713 [Sphaeroforma arctica JP610]KNC86144.1 hypothetical protein SARC_01713 [Sphaeroforma arctica JP610]|eukprot:XP_014160046.1 hypothetical protein SARC_01713 [Sphaeroforma arctica JP610]
MSSSVNRRVSTTAEKRISYSMEGRASYTARPSYTGRPSYGQRMSASSSYRPSIEDENKGKSSVTELEDVAVSSEDMDNNKETQEAILEDEMVANAERLAKQNGMLHRWLYTDAWLGFSRGHWVTCGLMVIVLVIWMVTTFMAHGAMTHENGEFGQLHAVSFDHPYDYDLAMDPLTHVEWHIAVEWEVQPASETYAGGGHRRRNAGIVQLFQELERLNNPDRVRRATDTSHVGVNGTMLTMTTEVVRLDDGVWSVVPDTQDTQAAVDENGLITMSVHHDLTAQADAEGLAARVYINSLEPVPMVMKVYQTGWFGNQQVWVAGVTLVAMYVLIVFEITHRTIASLLGMSVTLMWLVFLGKFPSVEEAFGWLEQGVLMLLFGMMLIVFVISQTGVFEWMAIQAYKLCRNKLWLLMVILATVTGVLSAFLDNVTTMLLMAPVTIRLANLLGIDPRPMLICECIMSNIGGTATMIGDPPNIIIGQALGDYIGFVDFLFHMLPGVVIIFPFALGFLWLLFRKDLKGDATIDDLESVAKDYQVHDKPLLMRVGMVFVVVILLFFTEPVHHIDVAWVALIGAVLMLLVSSPEDAETALEHVEWDTLVFFSSLFIMIEGLAEMGLITWMGDMIGQGVGAAAPEQQMMVAIIILIWVSGIVSAFLDNIPFTTTMVPVVLALANNQSLYLELEPMAWALAFGACLGGNGTLIGASANLVTAAVAQRDNREISFMYWFRYGFPTMILTLIVATAYMLVRYVLLADSYVN